MTFKIVPSEWGFTAFTEDGIAVAHSHDKELLDDYLVNGGKPDVSVPKRTGGVHPGPQNRNVGARNVSQANTSGNASPLAVTSETLVLAKVSYTSRSRLTGATLSTGRTATGQWATLCTNHGSTIAADNGADAEKKFKIIDEWCPGCAEIIAGRQPKIPKNASAELESLL